MIRARYEPKKGLVFYRFKNSDITKRSWPGK